MNGTAGATSSEAKAGLGRQMRVLALHGSPGNSNVMKFQTARLQKALGKDAEWLFMDGLLLWERYEASSGSQEWDWITAYNAERSPLEKMISKDKPFLVWTNLAEPEPGAHCLERESRGRAGQAVAEYVDMNAPIDAVVTLSQGFIAGWEATKYWRVAGRDVPWKVWVAFAPSDPDWQNVGDSAFILSVADKVNVPLSLIKSKESEMTVIYPWYQKHFNHVCRLIHDEPGQFPSQQEIYSELAAYMWWHCDGHLDFNEPSALLSGVLPRELLASWLNSATARDKDPFMEKLIVALEQTGTIPPGLLNGLSPEVLADMLLSGECIIADIREAARMRSRPFPGAQKQDISPQAMHLSYLRVRSSLEELRRDGRRLVIVSSEDSRSHDYRSLLLDRFGFQAANVTWLCGSIHAWEVWEMENIDIDNRIRSAYGLRVRQGADVATISPAELVEMLREDACLVADVREPAEARSRAFPAAQRHVSFLTLKKKPHQARRTVERLRGDGRKLVAVSVTGARCTQYCSMLIREFGFKAESVCWLQGGIHAWEAWAIENEAESREIHEKYEVSLPRGRPSERVDDYEALREHSLGFID